MKKLTRFEIHHPLHEKHIHLDMPIGEHEQVVYRAAFMARLGGMLLLEMANLHERMNSSFEMPCSYNIELENKLMLNRSVMDSLTMVCLHLFESGTPMSSRSVLGKTECVRDYLTQLKSYDRHFLLLGFESMLVAELHDALHANSELFELSLRFCELVSLHEATHNDELVIDLAFLMSSLTEEAFKKLGESREHTPDNEMIMERTGI